ncbi:hypothetical protein [uncultured Hyphomicrobium sp.]|nr:hypothetical protein [uncultured Hyphomicrobium sp.]
MKTTLTILAAVVMPGGFIVLAVALGTFLIARHRARTKTVTVAVAAP